MWLRGQELIKHHRFDKNLGGKTARILNIFSFGLSSGARKKHIHDIHHWARWLLFVIHLSLPYDFVFSAGGVQTMWHSILRCTGIITITQSSTMCTYSWKNTNKQLMHYVTSVSWMKGTFEGGFPYQLQQTCVFISQWWSLSLGSLSTCNMPMHI